MIFRVKYFDIEKAKFEIVICNGKQTLIDFITDILNDEHKSLKSITKI